MAAAKPALPPSVRFDPATGLGSVLDAIGASMGAHGGRGEPPRGMRWVWRDLRRARPELEDGVVRHKFPGRSQRRTPAAPLGTLWAVHCAARDRCRRLLCPGHLYVVTCPLFAAQGIFKVGMTTGARARLLSRYGTAWPEPPHLLAWVRSQDVVRDERAALAALRPHLVRGEFVRGLVQGDVVAAVAKAARRPESKEPA